MPQPSNNGVVLTMGFSSDRNRFECVIPMVYMVAPTNPIAVAQDFNDWVENTLVPAWINLLASDCFFAGYTLEAMNPNLNVIPDRRVYAADAFPGAEDSDSSPAQTSMLIAFYSTEQIATGDKIVVGKSFIGPCPEAKLNSGIITDTAFLTALDAFGSLMLGFTGSATGFDVKRVLSANDAPVGTVDVADVRIVRQNLFTQRRRMHPMF